MKCWEDVSLSKRSKGEVLGIFFSHRAHRVHGACLLTFRTHRRPPADREHRAFSAIVDNCLNENGTKAKEVGRCFSHRTNYRS